ncbi:MAG: hypothetical protein QM741_03955 [Rudaea sp.]|uniref:hypothetical protein n=1 Tax=Rudaea sp. TaxID=2136325 RepID=UPI0039E44E9E
MRATVSYSSVLPLFGKGEPAIAVRIAQVWLVVGCFAVLFLPALRGRSEWIGWLPLWLVIVPAAQLAILRRRALFAASTKVLGRLRRLHAQPAPRRVRKSSASRRSSHRHGTLLAAFLFR